MTSDFEGFSIPDFIHYIYFPILIFEKEPVFPFSMLGAKQVNYWYHIYNVIVMTRSLTGHSTTRLSRRRYESVESTLLHKIMCIYVLQFLPGPYSV